MATEIDSGLRNAILGLVERRRRRARRCVAGAARDLERAVHELRRMCKELRALWRMLRPAVGEEVYGRENARLRDAARALSGARDASVMLDTFAAMGRRRRGRRGREDWRRVGVAFRDHVARTWGAAPAPATVEGLMPALTGVLDAFGATHEAFDGLPLEINVTWQPGVRQVYRIGRKRMRAAYASGADADFHNWRKSTKDLFFQLRLLERMKQARPGRRVQELKKLEKMLGRDHDLAVLRERIAGLVAADQDPGARVLGDLARHSARLRKLARKPGRRLFGDKPEALIEAIEKRRRCAGRSDSAPSTA